MEAPDLLWKAIRKHWLLASLVASAVLLTSVFYTLGQKRIFKATATVQIDPTPPRPLGSQVQNVVDLGAGAYWSNREYYATQHRMITSRAIAQQTVVALGLNRDERFVQNVSPSEQPKAIDRKGQPVSVDDAASILVGRLRVDPVKESRLAEVSLEDADPERARRILATLLDIYLQRNVDQAVSSIDSASEWLHSQVGKLKAELENNELELHKYKKGKQILSVSLDDQSNMLREEMAQLGKALTQVQTRQETLAARDRELRKIDSKDPVQLPATELLNNPVLNSLRQSYTLAKADLAVLRGGGRGDNHPEVQAAVARVSTTREALLAEVKNVQGAVRSDLNGAKQEAGGLTQLLEAAKQRAFDLNLLEIEYRRLERAKENTEKLYSLVIERSKESDLTGLMRFNNISIAEEAMASRAPVKPRVPLNLALGGLLGIGLGLVLAIGREVLDRRLRSPEDIEAELGLPFLGLLPAVDQGNLDASYGYGALRRRGRKQQDRAAAAAAAAAAPEQIVHSAPTSSVAEAARSVRTNILFAAPDNPFRRILVASASPSEGKTMVASTLAIAMAQAGQRVLLVDCDLRRSRLHKVYNRLNDVGVTSALLDPALLDRENLETHIPNLSLLPAGPRAANPAELLHSESFTRLLDELSRRYDRVIIDSPPLVAVTDAAILSTHVDATVFVARAFKTSRDVAKQALRALHDVGAKIAGCVLNSVDTKRRYGAYYYSYGNETAPDAKPADDERAA
jgi:capsular exopolysaccharide synthesis family protein